MWLFFCLNAFMGAGDWIPPVPAFLFQRNHPHGGKALPRNRTAKNTAPLAYAIRLRGRVPADAALTKMDGKMADFFGEKDSKNGEFFTKNIQEPVRKTCYNEFE